MKKVLIIILILLTIIFSGIAVYLKTREKAYSTKTVSVTVSYPNDSIKGGLPIALEVQEKDFKFPGKIPYLQKTSFEKFSEDRINLIAQNLGFTNEAKTFEDIQDGEIYIWNGNTHDLVITPNLNKIKYSPNHNPYREIKAAQNKQLAQKDLISIAEDFLKGKIGIPENQFEFIGITFLKIDGGYESFIETEIDKAMFYQLNFSQRIENYFILTSNPQQSLYYVQILKDGSILNSEIQEVGLFKKDNFIEIKDFNGFTSALNKAVLVNLDEGNINLPDLDKKKIKEILIKEISLGYLLDNIKSTTLAPVFLLKGTAKIDGVGNQIKAFLYLSAVSEK